MKVETYTNPKLRTFSAKNALSINVKVLKYVLKQALLN